MKRITLILFACATALIRPLSAQQGDPLGDVYVSLVAKPIWGNIASQMTFSCTGNAGGGTLTASGGPPIGPTVDMPRMGVRMIPGVTYFATFSVSVSSPPNPSANQFGALSCGLSAYAPPGYTVQMKSFTQWEPGISNSANFSNLAAQYYSATVLIRIVPASKDLGLRAGMATSLSATLTPWQLSLGAQRNGTSAGTLAFHIQSDTAPLTSTFTRSNLTCDATTADVLVLGDSANINVIRQVIAPQVCVDITGGLTSGNIQINCYHPSKRSANVDSNTGYYTFTGSPYVSYTVTPNASDPVGTMISSIIYDTTTTSVGAAVRTLITKLTRSGTSPAYTWSADAWHLNGTTSPVTASRSRTGATETIKLVDSAGAVAVQSTRTYQSMLGSEEIVSEQSGSTNSVTTSSTFYTDDTAAIFYGWPKLSTSTGGRWRGFTYGSNGTVQELHTPWNNVTSSGFPGDGGAHTIMAFALDAFGLLTRPTSSSTTVGGVTVAQSTTTYSDTTPFSAYTTHPGLTVVQADRTDNSDASTPLSSTTKYFVENAGDTMANSSVQAVDDYFRGLPFSEKRPDCVKICHSYQRGSAWDGTNFTLTANNGLDNGPCSRITVITGSSLSTAGANVTAENGIPIDSVYLVNNKSTKELSILNQYSDLVYTSSWVWNGSSWIKIGSVTYTYNLAHELVSRVTTNGTTWSATYSAERRMSDTSESGLTLTYTYDDADRVSSVSKPTSTTTSVKTTYVYDAIGHALTETTSTAGATDIVASRTYDDGGRILTETPAGLGQMVHSYDPVNRTHTITLPDGSSSTRVETSQVDGRLASITGTGVVPEYYSYTVESDGRTTTRLDVGAASSVRYGLTRSDWLGRPVHKERPGYNGSTFSEDYTYQTNGLLQKESRTGYADTYYAYDALSNVTRTGLDVDGGGSLVLASNDRITDTDQYFENWNSAWWFRQTTKTYPKAGDGTALTTQLLRTRLSGFSGGRFEEVQSTDVDNNTTIRTVDVTRSTATAIITTTLPGLASTQIETVVDGLSTSVATPDGLTLGTQYDGFGRPWKKTDSRSNVTTLGYAAGSSLLTSVTDGANNPTSFGYDLLGRRTSICDALGNYSYVGYNPIGQVRRQWGAASYPVEYGYDPTYGDRTTISTYRGGAGWTANTWPASPGTADTTTWVYEPSSGLMTSKIDAQGKVISFTYNSRGQTATRLWARNVDPADQNSARVTATYGYDSSTGELTGISYNDNKTHAVGYSYTRLGQLDSASDGTGNRDFVYDPAALWRLSVEVLDSGFYGGRQLGQLYDSATSSSAGTYGGYTIGTVTGRANGFQLGTSSSPSVDLLQTYSVANSGRFAGITSAGQDFIYSYAANSRLLGGYTAGANFAVSYTYDSKRDLRTKVDSTWAAGSVTRFDFAYDAQGRRQWAKQSGTAFGDYTQGATYGAVYNFYGYNERGEVQSSAMYRGDSPPTSGAPASGDQLPGRRFEYRYDNLGNRKTAGETGTSPDDEYSTNSLNQYTQHENNTVRVLGNTKSTATVASLDATLNKLDRSFGGDIVPANTGGPKNGTFTLYAAILGGGAGGSDLVGKQTRDWSVAQQTEQLGYDADGNLTSDGLWSYLYDAENRLVQMTSNSASVNAGFPNKILYFTYDYLGRRVEKHSIINGAHSARRYVYNGWALIAEFDAPYSSATGATTFGNLLRTYSWGMDLVGSLDATGGVGALLQISDKSSSRTYFPTYDGNGNVSALVQNTGALAQVYEYGPFGEILRSENFDATIKDNAFRFSTKFADLETGLVYYGARFYCPGSGRFINRDPIEEAGGLNLYGFCGNDSINRTDYLGNSWLSKLFRKAKRWIYKHSQVAVPLFSATPLGAVAWDAEGKSVWGAAKRNPEIATVVAAIATWYLGGVGAAAVGITNPVGVAVVEGASSGFAGGFVGTRASGGSISDSFHAGLRSAAINGVAEGVGAWATPYMTAMTPDSLTLTSSRFQFVNKIQGNFYDGFVVGAIEGGADGKNVIVAGFEQGVQRAASRAAVDAVLEAKGDAVRAYREVTAAEKLAGVAKEAFDSKEYSTGTEAGLYAAGAALDGIKDAVSTYRIFGFLVGGGVGAGLSYLSTHNVTAAGVGFLGGGFAGLVSTYVDGSASSSSTGVTWKVTPVFFGIPVLDYYVAIDSNPPRFTYGFKP